MQLTISEAARLYKRHRATVHRHIKAGLLSCSYRGDGGRVIDLSELIRAYGEPDQLPDQVQQDATPPSTDMQHAMLQELQAMRLELVALRQEVSELRRLPAPEKVERSTKPVSSFEELLNRHNIGKSD